MIFSTSKQRIGFLICVVLAAAAGFMPAFAQEAKTATVTYTGQIIKIDKKAKTITIKGPAALVPAPEPKGRGGAVPPTGGRRGGRTAAPGATPRGPDMRAFEDVETKIVWDNETEVESSDGKLNLPDLKVGDYVLVETTKDGKKIRAVKLKRTTAGQS